MAHDTRHEKNFVYKEGRKEPKKKKILNAKKPQRNREVSHQPPGCQKQQPVSLFILSFNLFSSFLISHCHTQRGGERTGWDLVTLFFSSSSFLVFSREKKINWKGSRCRQGRMTSINWVAGELGSNVLTRRASSSSYSARIFNLVFCFFQAGESPALILTRFQLSVCCQTRVGGRERKDLARYINNHQINWGSLSEVKKRKTTAAVESKL